MTVTVGVSGCIGAEPGGMNGSGRRLKGASPIVTGSTGVIFSVTVGSAGVIVVVGRIGSVTLIGSVTVLGTVGCSSGSVTAIGCVG